jgi:ferritin-like metal-binding protein YciE
MKLENLRDAYHDQLKDMHSAEKQLTEALPKMLEAASSPDLKRAIQEHLAVTERQLERVSRLLESNNVSSGGKKCKAMEGLVEEASEIMKKDGDRDARDAAIIAAAQKVEHYEIASYGSLRSWAMTLGESEEASILQEILDEEYLADKTLTGIAESHLNREASN